MATADFTFSGPANHWRILMAGGTPLRRSVLDAEALDVTVEAASNTGGIYDPSGATVEMAFLADWVNPTTPDWHAGTWAVGLTGLHVAQINPGPGGLALAVGTYYVWVRITDGALADSPIVQQLGTLIIQ